MQQTHCLCGQQQNTWILTVVFEIEQNFITFFLRACVSVMLDSYSNRNRFRITQFFFCWNRNQEDQKALESEPESESENFVLESE